MVEKTQECTDLLVAIGASYLSISSEFQTFSCKSVVVDKCCCRDEARTCVIGTE